MSVSWQSGRIGGGQRIRISLRFNQHLGLDYATLICCFL